MPQQLQPQQTLKKSTLSLILQMRALCYMGDQKVNLTPLSPALCVIGDQEVNTTPLSPTPKFFGFLVCR